MRNFLLTILYLKTNQFRVLGSRKTSKTVKKKDCVSISMTTVNYNPEKTIKMDNGKDYMSISMTTVNCILNITSKMENKKVSMSSSMKTVN